MTGESLPVNQKSSRAFRGGPRRRSAKSGLTNQRQEPKLPRERTERGIKMTEKSKSGLVSATEDAPPGRLSTASSQAPVTSASRELDERVAEEVMKWTRSGRAWIDDRGHLRTIEPTSFGSFQPSTSIADAWLVWTYLVKHGWTIGLEYMKTAQGMQYRCDLHRTSDGSVVDAFATEAPLAICLAALRALDA